MKAVGYLKSPLNAEVPYLSDLTVDYPEIKASDLLIKVKAVCVNPIDYKAHFLGLPQTIVPTVLGWEAAGVVVETGRDVQGFQKGDQVYYLGEFDRSGANAEFQAIDYRLVAHMPSSLNYTQAATLPLTCLQAYDALFYKLKIPKDQSLNILIMGGEKRVSSVLLSLMKSLTSSRAFVTYQTELTKKELAQRGADALLNIDEPLLAGMQRLSIPYFDGIFSTTHHKYLFPEFNRILRPFGEVCLIDDPDALDKNWSKDNNVSFDFLLSKSLSQLSRQAQSRILNQIALLIDQKKIECPDVTVLNGLTAKNFMQAHLLLEETTQAQKIVINY